MEVEFKRGFDDLMQMMDYKGEWEMDDAKKQLLNQQLSNLRVSLHFAKLSVCDSNWKRDKFIPSYNKLYYICSGEGWIEIGGKPYRPKPGELMFIPGGLEQAYSVTEGTPYTMYWCHFKSNISFMRLFHWFNLSNVVSVDDPFSLQNHFRELAQHRTNKGPATSIQIQAALLSIISYFINQSTALGQSSDVSPVSMRKLLNSIHYIDNQLGQNITIEELSQQAHFHPNYFIRIFKRHLGMPPMRYIQERRLERAQQLLASTDRTIGEVAHLTGFNDISHFSAAFKKNMGVSPSDYRKLVFGNDRTKI